MNSKTLRVALKLLKWFCPDHLYEEIEGDLIQQFYRDSRKFGTKKAERRLVWKTIRFLRPGILFRNKFSVEIHLIHMLHSYFKIAYRHLMKSKTFSIINITGLAVGIAAFTSIILYVDYEMNYDQFHSNKNEIYRVAYKEYQNGELLNASAKNFMGLGYWMEEQFPEVQAYTHFWKVPANSKFLIQYNSRIFNEPGDRIVSDSNFFSVFPSLLLKGNPETVLNNKHSLVISERVAERIFGTEDPVGKIIGASDYNDQYEITGILKNLQGSSHLAVDFVSPQDYSDDPTGNWKGPWRFTYVLLPEDIEASSFESKLNRSLQSLSSENLRIKDVSLLLQSVTDIHLNSNFKDELRANGNMTLVFVLITIAGIILLIAWINYINLETSRFILRAREVGVRRIVGSTKSDLIFQFLIEYFCVNVISVILSAGLLLFFLPHLSFYIGLEMDQIDLMQPEIFIPALLFFAIGSLLIGSYPALLLSRINPVSILRAKLMGGRKNFSLRKILLTFQFVSSIVLIAFVIVVHDQLDFMRTSNKKIDLERIVSVINPTVYSAQEQKNTGEGGYANFLRFKNKLLEDPAIAAVSSSSAIPGETIGFTYTDLIKRNMRDPYDPTAFKVLFVDYNFISLYGLNLKAGRNYDSENGEDENWSTLILNESAIKALNFNSPEDGLGQEVYFMPDFEWNKYKIVGVLEDYHHEALKRNILPTIFFLNHNKGQQVYYSVKFNAGALPQNALASVERSWKTVFPDKPFEYFFVDDYYDQQFKSEIHFGRIFTSFAAIAIFIAGIGILGMTLFESNARLKEISIRKILGASAASLVVLFSGGHIRIVLLSTWIAAPLIYFIASDWLQGYPLRIKISPLLFVLPMAVILCIVIFTSCVQTIKAASTNLVDNLKHE